MHFTRLTFPFLILGVTLVNCDDWVRCPGVQKIGQTDLAEPTTTRLTFVSLLEKYVPPYFSANRDSLTPHTRNILARIALCRLVSDVDGRVTLMARSLNKPAPGEKHQLVEVTIPGLAFAERWATHILPKYLVRVRHYVATVVPTVIRK